VALDTEILTLARELRGLRETAAELCLAVVEDRPARPDVALVDRLEERVTDVAGEIDEALDAVGRVAVGAARGDLVDVRVAGDALARSQARLDVARAIFWEDVASYEGLAGLVAFVAERGGEWSGWMAAVQQALRRCRTRLASAGQAQGRAWHEVAERAALAGVNVHTTTVGQHLTMASGREQGGER
jgi:hypothetical protein